MSDGNEHPKLETALKGLARGRVFVSAEKDEEIRRVIRNEFENAENSAMAMSFPRKRIKPSHRARPPQWWQRWMPLAASIMIAGLIFFLSWGSRVDPADVNGDGKVDVIDALILATRLNQGDRGADVNGDGVVDEKDTSEIVVRSVRLDGGRS